MAKTQTDCENILKTGASLTLNCIGRTGSELESLASIAAKAGGMLTNTNAEMFTMSILSNIANQGKSHVHFVF